MTLPSRWSVDRYYDRDLHAHKRPQRGLDRSIEEDRLPEMAGDALREATVALWRELYQRMTAAEARVAELERPRHSEEERLALRVAALEDEATERKATIARLRGRLRATQLRLERLQAKETP